jgi:hypothetical protein
MIFGRDQELWPLRIGIHVQRWRRAVLRQAFDNRSQHFLNFIMIRKAVTSSINKRLTVSVKKVQLYK